MSPLDDEPEDDPYKHVTTGSKMIFSVCRISGHYGTFEQKRCSLACANYLLCRVGCGFEAVGCDFQCQSVDCIDTEYQCWFIEGICAVSLLVINHLRTI